MLRYVALAALLLIACEGPTGPAGPSGPQGPEGEAVVQPARVVYTGTIESGGAQVLNPQEGIDMAAPPLIQCWRVGTISLTETDGCSVRLLDNGQTVVIFADGKTPPWDYRIVLVY